MELAGDVGGVRFVNDSKATNIVVGEAVVRERGRRARGDSRWALQGRRLRATCGRRSQDARAGVIAIGESAPLIEEALADVVPVARAASMDDAVRQALRLATPGDTVVLAPACSSFDMFATFAERGRAFKEAVRQARRRGRGRTVSREQSSVGTRRLRAGCWERRLPRPAKLVSQPRSTGDC